MSGKITTESKASSVGNVAEGDTETTSIDINKSTIDSNAIVDSYLKDQPDYEKPLAEDMDIPVPPDGGWGWVVVVASLFVNIIVDGVTFSFGIIYVELLEYFGESKGKTAWIGSLIPGMYLGAGPIVGALANRYGCRIVTIIGSIVGAISFFISTYSPNVNVMIVTYGIMGGLGFGLMYLPSIVIVGFYFSKKRAFATGLAVCGSGIGTFIFAPFSRYLLAKYGWKGANWIMAAIILNGIVMGLVFKPLKRPSEIEAEKRKKDEKRMQQRISEGYDPKPSAIIQKIIEEKNRQRTISTGSLDGTYITRDNKLIKDKEILKILEIREENEAKRLTKVEEVDEETQEDSSKSSSDCTGSTGDKKKLLGKKAANPETVSLSRMSRSDSRESFPIDDVRSRSSSPRDRERFRKISSELNPLRYSNGCLTGTPPVYRRLERIKIEENGSTRPRAFTVGNGQKPARPNRQPIVGSVPNLHSKNSLRKDVLLSQSSMAAGSVMGHPEAASFTSSLGSIPILPWTQSTHSIMSVTDEEGNVRSTTCNEKMQLFKSLFFEMFDFSLLKNLTFLLLCTASILAMLGFFVPFFYVVDCALNLGTSVTAATFLLSVIGIANTVGRVLVGWVSDRPWADCLVIHNVALILGGLGTAAVPYLPSYGLLCAYCSLFGFSIAAYIALRSIVLVELLGVQKLTSSFGLLLLFQGFASIIGPPLAGVLVDVTGSYTMSFILAGACLGSAGVLCLPIRRIAKWENRRLAIRNLEYNDDHLDVA